MQLIPSVVGRYRDLIENLETTAARDTDRAREQLRHLLGDEIRLVPENDYLVAELGLSAFRMLKSVGTVNNRGTEERT